MTRQKPKLRILRREKQKLEESVNETENNRSLQAGDILVYDSIVKDAVYVNENDGKMYLCLGEASSEELGQIGDALSGAFSSIKIVAVLGESGVIDYFLDEELKLADNNDD